MENYPSPEDPSTEKRKPLSESLYDAVRRQMEDEQISDYLLAEDRTIQEE